MSRVIKPDSGQSLVLQDQGGSAALTIDTDGSVTIEGTVIPSDSTLVENTNVLVQSVSVAENATFEREFDIDYEGSAKVMVAYGSRDTAGTRLYTEGFVVSGQGVASYFETVAGDKTSANTGTISISVPGTTDNSSFKVEKTAGGTTSGGVITIMIISNNVTQA